MLKLNGLPDQSNLESEKKFYQVRRSNTNNLPLLNIDPAESEQDNCSYLLSEANHQAIAGIQTTSEVNCLFQPTTLRVGNPTPFDTFIQSLNQ